MKIDIHSHRPLRELVYEELREMILTGDIKPGTRLMEVELAGEMGVSRTPIREALIRLAHDHIIEMYPKRGAFVPQVTVKDILELYELRIANDGVAAFLFTENAAEEDRQNDPDSDFGVR